MVPSKKEFRPYYQGDSSCQETHNSEILYQTISGTQTHETVETNDRFKYFKQSFACTNFQNGNSQIYQEVDSKRAVGHLDRPHRHLFSCSNTFTISKISEISDKKRGFQFWALIFGVATAPLEFTRIVKEVKLIAQARDLRIHQYLDNCLLRSPTKEHRAHGGRVVTLSPPTSETGVRLCDGLKWESW